MSLTLHDISHHYRHLCALNTLNATFETGHVHAVLGPNGAGKSTLFKLIAGLIPLQAGQISLDGTPIVWGSHQHLKRFGCVFQETALDPMRTGRANLMYAAGLHGLSARDSRLRVDTLAKQLHCADFLDRPVAELSGGQRRRIELTRALIHEPDWLLLDEPSAGLDIDSRRQLSLDIHHMTSERQCGVVWCTHITDELLPEDRLMIMRRGQLIACGPCGSQAELMARYAAEVQADA